MKKNKLEKILLQFLLKYEKMKPKERKVLLDVIIKMTTPVILNKSAFRAGQKDAMEYGICKQGTNKIRW